MFYLKVVAYAKITRAAVVLTTICNFVTEPSCWRKGEVTHEVAT